MQKWCTRGIRLSFMAVCICIGMKMIAQSAHPIFDHITTAHGLSSDKVSNVIQDREGLFWIATQNGLNRFDGTSFKTFRNIPGDSTSITHHSCSALLEDLNGDIWVGTYSGISQYKKSEGLFQQIYLHHPAQIFSIANRINSLALDHEGNIWISSYGLWKYDVKKDSLILFQKDDKNPASIYDDNYCSKLIYDGMRKGMWFVSPNAIQFYSFEEEQFYHELNNPLNWKIFNPAYGVEIALDRKGRIWFISKNTLELLSFDVEKNSIMHTGKILYYGLRRISIDDENRLWLLYWLASTEIYDPDTRETSSEFFKVRHNKSILSDKVVDLYIDHEKNYWISSTNGISIYNPKNQFYRLFPVSVDRKGYENDLFGIKAIAQTDSHSLWLATNIGLYNYDLPKETWQHVSTSPELSRITALSANREKLWIAHEDDVHQFNTHTRRIENSFEIENNIFYLEKGNANDLWVGIWRGGVYKIDLATKKVFHFKADSVSENALLTNSTISALSDNEYVWFGYNLGKGFSRYDTRTNSFTHYNPGDVFPFHANAGIIPAIEKDKAGSLWLGTHGSGVIKWDPAKNEFTSYDQSKGLKSNFINSLVPDESNNIWISTTDGINYFNADKGVIQAPDISFVFPINDHVANGIKGIDGYLYFFKPTDIIQIHSKSYTADTLPAHLIISSFKVFDDEYYFKPGEALHLNYDQNFFKFEFSKLKTNPRSPVRYAYKLKGFDKDWIYSNVSNIASYTNVPAGNYTFLVKATNDEGIWSEELIHIPLSITPPFWRTWWFISLLALLVAGALYALHRYRLAQVKKIMSVRTRISQDLHDDIGGSLSSIYIYSSVAEKELANNPVKTKELLNQIHTNSRQVMDNISDIVWANNKTRLQESTLEGRIKNYGYELLSQKNIECVYSIDPHIESRLTSPEARRNILLIIKEALNNMAKYSGASQAHITIQQKGNQLFLSIEDNGQGFDVHNRKNGHGIATMQQRASGLNGQMNIQSSPGKGTTIQCTIPLASISD